MSDRAGIDLNTVQIVSSMGAAVTGAILTSYLGDGGTIAGTAVGAGASTAGFAVYKHYLARTKDKVAPVIAGHARQWSPTTQASSRRAAAAEQTEARTAASPGRAVPSDDRTRPDRGQVDPQRPETWQAGPRQPGTWQADPRQADPRQADPRQAATEKMPAFGTGWASTGGAVTPGRTAVTETAARTEPPGPAETGRLAVPVRTAGRPAATASGKGAATACGAARAGSSWWRARPPCSWSPCSWSR